MPEELIKERHSSYTNSAHILDPSLKVSDPGFSSTGDRYTTTLASCKDLPLPIYAAKALFVETEQEIIATRQDSKERQKINFLKRLTLDNIKIRFTEFMLRFKDTIVAYRESVTDFLKGEVKSQKTETAKHAKNAKKTEQKVQADSYPIDDVESRRIREIENASAYYADELMKTGGSEMNAMIEMACKLAILIGSLGYRYNKKEIKDYMKHLEVNVQKRVKTFEGGRAWTYVSVGLQAGAAGLSFLSLGAGAPKVGGLLKALSQTSSPLSSFGSATYKLSEIESEKKQGKRTGFEHEGEKMKQFRTSMEESNQKIHQSTQEIFSSLRGVLQTHTDAVKRAAAAG